MCDMAGIDSYTKLMLHCNGTDGSQTFTDSSPSPKDVTANGDAQINTAVGSPINHWKMNDNAANTTVVDSMGTNNGTAARNTEDFDTTGKINGALIFNGSSDKVIPSYFAQPASFTITAWIQTENHTADNGVIFSWGGTDANPASDAEFRVSSSKLQYGEYAPVGGWASVTSTGNVTSASFVHVAVVNNAGTITLYINGSPDGTGTVDKNLTLDGVAIGQREWNNDYWFNGKIDDLRFYNTALTRGDILEIYNGGSGTEDENPSLVKFGTGSALCDGTGDYLSLVDSDDWNFGSGDFTIDLWTRFDSVAANRAFCQQYVDGQNYWHIFWHAGATRFVVSNVTANVNTVYVGFDWSPSINTWYHIAVVKSSGVTKIYIDGTSKTLGWTTDGTFGDFASNFEVGRSTDGSAAMSGWIDELRISKGIARWTSNFTPPTAEYDSATVYTQTCTETITVTDIKPFNSTVKTLSDSVTLTDIKPVRDISKNRTESVTLTDTKPLKVLTKMPLVESVTLTEGKLLKGLTKSWSESVTLTDTKPIKGLTTTKSESVTIADVVNKTLSGIRTFLESVALTESKVVKSVVINKLESVSLTDYISKDITKAPFTETVALSDTVSKLIMMHALLESCTLTELVNKGIIKLAFVENMTATERYEWWFNIADKSSVWVLTTGSSTIWIAVDTSTTHWTPIT